MSRENWTCDIRCVALLCAHTISGARGARTPGRLAPKTKASARRPRYPFRLLRLPRPGPPSAPPTKEEPKMTCRMSRAQKLWMSERAAVLQVLRDDHPERWTLEELTQEIEDMPAEIVREAVRRLGGVGVVVLSEEACQASRAVRRIDALELISI